MEQRAQVKAQANYVCVNCLTKHIYTTATVVDHRIPLHLGGTNDPSNLDPLCDACHNAKTAQEAKDRTGHGG